MFVLHAIPGGHRCPSALFIAEFSVFSGVPGKTMDTWWMLARSMLNSATAWHSFPEL